MRVAEIEVFNLSHKYAAGRGFRYAGGICTGRLTSLVRVIADNGMVGWGSAYSHPDLIRTVIEGHLKPQLLGDDPTEVETLWTKMYNATRWYGRKGAAVSALGALDVAFWDLRGKHYGKPVRALLGSDRHEVPGYASALLWQDDLANLTEEAARHADHGFQRMKMRLGRGWDYDCAALAAVRKGAGAKSDIMCDGSMRYSVEAAEKLAKHLKSSGVFWFEEPFAPDDIDSFLALRPRVDMRIAAGENEFGFSGFRELLRANAIDIAQADASRCGGLTEVMRVGRLCDELGAALAPHSWSDAIAIIANAQAVAVCRNAITVEIDQTGNPFVDSLLTEPLVVRDGQLKLSDRPGLGFEVDLSVVKALRIAEGQSVPPGNYSDMAFGAPAPGV